MQTYKISFPSIHGPGGSAFEAEATAPSESLAIREVLEAAAIRGVPLRYVVLSHIRELPGAVLDGLILSHCYVRDSDLTGVSLRGARFEHTTFDHVHADHTTRLDGASLEIVNFKGCSLNGLAAPCMNAGHISFYRTHASGLDISGAKVSGLNNVGFTSTLAAWKHDGAEVISGSFDAAALFAPA